MFSVYGSFQINRKPSLFPVGRRALTPPHLITKQTNQLSRTIIECAKRRVAVPPPYDVRMKMQLNPGRILHLFSVGTALRSEPYSAAKPRFNLMRLRAHLFANANRINNCLKWDPNPFHPATPEPQLFTVYGSDGGAVTTTVLTLILDKYRVFPLISRLTATASPPGESLFPPGEAFILYRSDFLYPCRHR